MNAYISSDINMVKELDPKRHELALLQADWLEKGGTIEVLSGPSFKPAPERHEPPPKPVVPAKIEPPKPPKPLTAAAARQKTNRQIERDERTAERLKERNKLTEQARELALTMNYTQAMRATGKSRKLLMTIAKEGGFSFQVATYIGHQNLRPHEVDEAKDAKDAERIKAFKELGLTRNQAREKAGITFPAFIRILEKFQIDYPKAKRGGPRPAFFQKVPKQ
jgi:type IV secretory pathway VirB10-like protein